MIPSHYIYHTHTFLCGRKVSDGAIELSGDMINRPVYNRKNMVVICTFKWNKTSGENSPVSVRTNACLGYIYQRRITPKQSFLCPLGHFVAVSTFYADRKFISKLCLVYLAFDGHFHFFLTLFPMSAFYIF